MDRLRQLLLAFADPGGKKQDESGAGTSEPDVPSRPHESASPTPAPARSGRDGGLEESLRERLAAIGLEKLAKTITVSWNPRLRTTAGLAHWLDNRIELNPRLEGSGELHRTLLHEAAHLVARHRSGRRRIRPHGREWREACRDLGIPGEKATHELPWEKRKVPPRFYYRCPRCETVIPRVRPFRGYVACLSCCRKHSDGKYDDRFRLRRVAKPDEPGKSGWTNAASPPVSTNR